MTIAMVVIIGSFLVLVFASFFYWRRLATTAEPPAWRAVLVGSALACAMFAVCFAIGVWFSIARLKGEGWMQLE